MNAVRRDPARDELLLRKEGDVWRVAAERELEVFDERREEG